jgi:hypothetical protein
MTDRADHPGRMATRMPEMSPRPAISPPSRSTIHNTSRRDAPTATSPRWPTAGLNATKRTISRSGDGTRKGVRLSEAEGEGPAYLPDNEFANGTLELEMKGKDVQGGSFVGVAFHGVASSSELCQTSKSAPNN